MTIDKVIIFIIFTFGYFISMRYFSSIGLKLREIVKSRFLRFIVIIIMFCISVYYQGEFSELEVLSLEAVYYSFVNGVCVCVLFKLVWYKKLI